MVVPPPSRKKDRPRNDLGNEEEEEAFKPSVSTPRGETIYLDQHGRAASRKAVGRMVRHQDLGAREGKWNAS
jgi:hypothetical protein